MTVTTPGTAGPYLDQQVHVLVDLDTRAFTLGLAAIRSEATGRPPREGDAVRELLLDAITYFRQEQGAEYKRAMDLGHAELDRRSAAKASAE